MLSQKRFPFLLSFFLLGVSCFAFDVDGFRTGMSQEKVREILTERKITTRKDEPGKIITENHTHPDLTMTFFFRHNRLFGYSKQLPFSMVNFISIAEDLRRELGRPINLVADAHRIDSYGETSELEIWWKDGPDTVSLNYDIVGSTPQLGLSYVYTPKNP